LPANHCGKLLPAAAAAAAAGFGNKTATRPRDRFHAGICRLTKVFS
jgi:hypothetical protein